MTTVNPADISLRPATASDEPFLKRLHQSARHWEFAALVQSGEVELYHKIMEQQYDSQQRFYFAHYDKAQYGVIQWCGRSIGRLYADYNDEEVRVLDIAILPDYRGRGIGSIVITSLCLEAAMRHKPVRLCVHYLNRAVRLYQRLGFRRVGAEGPNYVMEWQQPDTQSCRRVAVRPVVES